LENIIVMSVIYGCWMMISHITVLIVDFVVLGERRTFNIVMIVGCVLIRNYFPITIVKVESTNRIALFVRNISSVQEVPLMRCPVVMRFIGNVSANWLPMIHVVPSVRRLPRLVIG